MELNKENKKALFGTGIFVVVISVILLLLGLSFQKPPPPLEGGCEINLGYSDQGMGEIQTEQPSIQPSAPQPVAAPERNVATQDIEESEYIGKETDRVENTNPAEEQPKIDDRYTDWKNFNKPGSSKGEGNQPGVQGSNGGNGNGVVKGPGTKIFGRIARSLPNPVYNVEEQGTVVVKIWVDQDGNVFKAEPGMQGTTTDNRTLWKHAKDAAMQSKFDQKPDAPPEQTGTITYTFIRKS